MRKLLIAASMLAGLCVGSVASAANNLDSSAPEMRAYMNFAFGGKTKSIANNFHYGLRLDQNRSILARAGRSMPSLAQVDFTPKSGFSSAAVNGVPFASRIVKFDEDGGETSYSMLDWGLLAIGAAGLGFGIAEVLKTKDDPDPRTTTTVVQGPNGPISVVVNTVTGAVQAVLDGAGIPIPLSDITGGLLTTVCGVASIPGVCLADRSSFERRMASQERDVQRIQWLDSGMGQMGDLVTVR